MPKLTAGDRIRLFGGYDLDPEWLRMRPAHYATVSGFFDNEIDGRSDDSRISASIEFEEELEFKGVRGRYGFIMGRWEGQTWETEGVVHVHLSDRHVSSAAEVESANTAWLESHASYAVDAA